MLSRFTLALLKRHVTKTVGPISFFQIGPFVGSVCLKTSPGKSTKRFSPKLASFMISGRDIVLTTNGDLVPVRD